jgi:hypothetical protein
MTKDQQSIIWLGLIVIALNIIVNLSEFKTVLFNKGPAGNAGAATPVPSPGTSKTPAASGVTNLPSGNNPQQTPPSVMVA